MFRKKVGLALGAGAARGWAHVGVISVLEREGIQVDMVAGTSAGSIVGALYAQGRTADQMKVLGRRLLKGMPWDPAFFSSGLIKGYKMKELLVEMLGGDVTFRDLKLPFACLSTDIITGEEVVIKDGSVAEAVRASISIPGIFTVVNRDGRYLVDGILTNPVPVNVVKQMGADFIIAVNVIPDANIRSEDFDRPLKEPKLTDVLMQSLHISSYSLSRVSLGGADLVIAPRVGHTGAGDFGRAKEYIQLGESAAVECLPRLRREVGKALAKPARKGGSMMARLSFLRHMWFMVFGSGLLLLLGTDWVLSATSNPGYVPTVLLIGAFLVPVTFVVYVYESEPDKEIPLGSIAITFLWGGALGAAVAGYLEFQTARIMPVFLIVGVGIIEEAAKLIVPLIFFYRDRYCPEADGLLFGVTAGMGFAALETMGYGFVALLQSQGSVDVLHQILLVRGLLSPAGHAAWTGLICSVLWRERDKAGHATLNRHVIWAIIAAIGLHSLWDIAGSFSAMMGPQFVAVDFIGLFVVAGLSMLLLIRRMRESRHLSHPPTKTCSSP